MTNESEAVMFHDMRHAGCLDPFADLIPRSGIVFQHPTDLKESDSAALEHIGDFRQGTSRTVGQPLARHLGAIAQTVEPSVINGGRRREVENDHWHFCPACHREYGGRKGISRDVQQNQIDIGAAKSMPCGERLVRSIDQPRFTTSTPGRAIRCATASTYPRSRAS